MKKKSLLALLLFSGASLFAQETSKNVLGQSTARVSTEKRDLQTNNDDDAVWEQDRSYAENEFSITSSHFELAEWGMYAADDFELAGETTINGIFFHGSQGDDDGASYINGIDIYFYEDENGVPAGNPSIEGSAVLEVNNIPIDSEFVEVSPGVDSFLGYKEYYVDIEGFLGEELSFSEGIYWISIVFNLDLAENDFDIRWLWNDSNTENLSKPVVIDPTNELNAGIMNWTKIEEVGFPMTDMAFTLFGETEVLSVSSLDAKNIQIYPNPTTDFLFISLDNGMEIESVFATDLSGRRHQLDFENNKVGVSHLAIGTYVLQINTSKGAILKKVIKK